MAWDGLCACKPLLLRGTSPHRYGVPASDADRFEDVVAERVYAPALAALRAKGASDAAVLAATQRALLGKTTMFSPKLLNDAGVFGCAQCLPAIPDMTRPAWWGVMPVRVHVDFTCMFVEPNCIHIVSLSRQASAYAAQCSSQVTLLSHSRAPIMAASPMALMSVKPSILGWTTGFRLGWTPQSGIAAWRTPLSCRSSSLWWRRPSMLPVRMPDPMCAISHM